MPRHRERFYFRPLHEPVSRNFEPGEYEVFVRTQDILVGNVRLSFTRGEVGNGNPFDGSSNPAVHPGQDGGLAVRLQAEDGLDGALIGPVSRFGDEGIIFRTTSPTARFDVRDVPGNSIGLFDVVALGVAGAETYDYGAETEQYYVNAGGGDDRIIGGRGNDYLIGAAGNDWVEGGDGDDVLIGAPGDDRLFGGAGNDVIIYRPAFDGSDQVDGGTGDDVVQVFGPAREIRLTWSTLQTGNGDANDSGLLAGEDGGLNVRFQSEDTAGDLSGPVSRYDDEGISFIGLNGVTFDLRNLQDGAMRGSGYGIVRLGSSGDDRYDDSAATVNVFHNGGRGDDRLIGGSGADHLVGLDGDDWLEGGAGDDLLVGLAGRDTFVFSGAPGSDRILTYEPGVDRIDLSAYGIFPDDVEVTNVGANAFVRVDTDGDGNADFEIFLGNTTGPLATDFIFMSVSGDINLGLFPGGLIPPLATDFIP